VDGHVAAAACLGVWLLAGTALSGVLASGPSFPAVGLSEAVAGRGDGAPEVRGRVPAAVPAPAGRQTQTSDAGRAPSPTRPLDINRADATDLQALPGVGPVLARRIVAHRETRGPFRNPADLLQVPGVGAKRFARLEGLIHTAEAP
jgi:competence protein ComEA